MNKYILVLGVLFFSLSLFAQEEEKEDKRPVKKPWESTLLIENQTTRNASKGGLELLIHHRFGATNNGYNDFFGIYAASNIRMSLQYGISDKLNIGIGTEKNNKLNDLYAKYTIIEQTRDNSIPLTVSAFGILAIDGREADLVAKEFKFVHRLSYFAQVLGSRKINNDLSVQIGTGYAHFNSVDSIRQHDRISIMAGGRYKFTKKMGVIFEYNHAIPINPVRDYQKESHPGLAFGIEIGTGTHAFQLFATNYSHIIQQKNLVMNDNKIDADGIRLGFNITVRF